VAVARQACTTLLPRSQSSSTLLATSTDTAYDVRLLRRASPC
jgi:hypothetical protein